VEVWRLQVIAMHCGDRPEANPYVALFAVPYEGASLPLTYTPEASFPGGRVGAASGRRDGYARWKSRPSKGIQKAAVAKTGEYQKGR